MDEHDMNELQRQVAAETSSNREAHASFKRRLDALEESGKRQTEILLTMQRQADAIEGLDKKMDGIATSVGNVEKRVEEIEKEPGDRWKKLAFEIVKYIVLAVVGVAAGYFIRG